MLCSLECDGYRYRCDMQKVHFLSQLKKGDSLVVTDIETDKPRIVKVIEVGYSYVSVRPLFSLGWRRRWFLRKGDVKRGIYVVNEIEML